jgi:hypothetical protein
MTTLLDRPLTATRESSVFRGMMSSARRQRLVMTIVGIALLAVFTWTQRVPVNSTTGSRDAIAEAFRIEAVRSLQGDVTAFNGALRAREGRG